MKTIIFDFDGVILDSVNVKTQAFAAMYKPYGMEVMDKVVKHHLLHGGVSRFEKFKIYHKDFLGKDISEDQVQELALQFSHLVLKKVLDSEYVLGAIKFLETVYKEYNTYVCTGTPQNEIELIVREKGLSKYFDQLFGSPTTKVEIINTIMNANNFKRDEVLFIGDAMTDYNAAKSTEIKFVGIRNSDTSFPEGTVLVDDLFDIVEKFKL